MNELALFAGAGGGLLASKWLLGWRTICYVENAEYPVKILQARIRDGLLDDAPIWDDVRTFDGRPWRGCVDIIAAGFPCQPFSSVGNKLAGNDDKNLWPDTIRVIRQVRPEWCLLENVSGLLFQGGGYFGTILRDLAESGYDASWRVLSAAEMGAPHKRDRLFVVAHTVSGESRVSIEPGQCEDASTGSTDCRGHTAQGWDPTSKPTWWDAEPRVGRMVDGVASGVDRFKAVGNGQVPFAVAAAWHLLTDNE